MNFSIGLQSDSYEPISFKLLYQLDTSFSDLNLHSKPQGCEKFETIIFFSRKGRSWFWMIFGMLLWQFSELKLISIGCSIRTKGREPCLCDFIQITVNVGLPSDAHQPISFKLDMMTDTT